MNAELWLLERPDGGTLATAADPRREGHEPFPAWHHRRLAEACATDVWEGSAPIRVDAWARLVLGDELGVRLEDSWTCPSDARRPRPLPDVTT